MSGHRPYDGNNDPVMSPRLFFGCVLCTGRDCLAAVSYRLGNPDAIFLREFAAVGHVIDALAVGGAVPSWFRYS